MSGGLRSYQDSDVEAVLDLRKWRIPMRPGPEDLAALWDRLEVALHGRGLRAGKVEHWDAEHGTISLEIVRVAPGVSTAQPGTRFGLVAVRELPRLVYRCSECDQRGSAAYGPFRCKPCEREGRPGRVCVEHVVVLEGSLEAFCPAHRPACRGCGHPAQYWCARPESCNSRVAWCGRHAQQHPQDPDTHYCSDCYRSAFPVCEERGCSSVGTVRCDWLGSDHQPCARQACTRHARRWQVFGSERVGLGLCAAHSAVRSLTPAQILYQICCGAARRDGVRIPSLAAFGHNLRNCRQPELALDYNRIRVALRALDADLKRRGPADVARAVDRAAGPWDVELKTLVEEAVEGERLVERLRVLVRDQDRGWGERIAAGLRLAQYKPARANGQAPAREAVLWVHLPEELRGKFIGPQGSRIGAYKSALGVEIRFEGGGRRGQR